MRFTRSPTYEMDDGRDNESKNIYPGEYNGPKARIPHVEVPKVDVPTSDSDAVTDSPMAALFVLHVVIWNAILLSFSLGVMLIYFRQNWTTGGQLIGVSIILTLYEVYRWPDNAE
jgi:hypothetical protein